MIKFQQKNHVFRTFHRLLSTEKLYRKHYNFIQKKGFRTMYQTYTDKVDNTHAKNEEKKESYTENAKENDTKEGYFKDDMIPRGFERFFGKPKKSTVKRSCSKEESFYEKKSGGRNPNLNEIKINPNIILSLSIISYVIYRISVLKSSKEITWQEFRTAFLDKGMVDKLTVVNRNKVRVHLHSNQTGQMYPETRINTRPNKYYFSIGSIEAFERRLDMAQDELKIPQEERIPVSFHDEISIINTVLSFTPTLLLIGSIFWLSKRASGAGGAHSGIFGIGKSRAKMFNHETDIKVKFKDVAGADEAKEEIMEFVKFLKNPSHYEKLGAKIPRGAILSGPPGTGKTLLAKATAGEANVPFLSVSGSEFIEMFVGVGPSRVRDLFSNARKHAPCIIFMDEIDAIGKARGRGNQFGSNDERESTLNQLLIEMDGFSTSEHVVVLAGTNRPDVLDNALLRPGRFDRHITIDRPDVSGREAIFMVHLKKIKIDEKLEDIAKKLSILTPGFSGADIASTVNEGALIAARHRANKVEMVHFEQAIERVVAGLEKKSRVLSPQERNIVAHHEAGHAVAGYFLEHVDQLLKVSIIPRSNGALGYASYLQKEKYLLSRGHILDNMVMTLAGRVSEEIFFPNVEITSGASDDFSKVTKMATQYVTTWGLSDLGTVSYQINNDQFQKPFSEETARMIDSEVRKLIKEAHSRCHILLKKHKDDVSKIAKCLLEKEVIGFQDVEKLLGPRPYPSRDIALPAEPNYQPSLDNIDNPPSHVPNVA
ncbi:hypothetical protein T552_00124 [Pneumocystis carinii B80]|uniref:AAA+ ATPase domain-containing protein n=1 Tax=Pneumocystis carinii (strain B80) TaxID=1408658 RepID=A0A0W4ZSX5_PNEC8|nr:hypothetical protein T552_00124 [Pneumocystis carinii B80]KTW31481.1 hypothetical protein T552_00124 [Pneumocystis carinii B80]